MGKNTMNSREVGHAWAHGRSPHGQNHGGTLYFSGATIYSYGEHYAIAHKTTDADGGTVVFINDEKNSVTTAKHVSFVRQSIPGYWTHYYAPELSGELLRDAAALVDACGKAAIANIGIAAKTREGTKKREDALETARDYIASAHAAAELLPRDKDAKKTARAALRRVPALPDGDNDALASILDKTARAEFRKSARDAADNFVGHVDILRSYIHAAENEKPRGLDSFRPFSTWNMENRAELRAADAHRELHRATRDAKKAGARNPIKKAAREEFATMRGRVAELAKRARAAFLVERAADLRLSVIQGAVPQHSGSIGNALEFAEKYAPECPELAAMLPELRTMRAESEKRDAEKYAGRCADDARRALESAASFADAGHFADALRELNRARRECDNATSAANNYGFTVPELPELPDGTAWRDALHAQHAERIAAWRAGSIASLPYAATDGPLLRLEYKAGEPVRVATSHYASVPISAVPIMWRLICKARRENRALEFKGKHVGAYDLRTIRADGSAVIGCHDIAAVEFDRIAAQLQLAPVGG